jgi:hypothetical protein
MGQSSWIPLASHRRSPLFDLLESIEDRTRRSIVIPRRDGTPTA